MNYINYFNHIVTKPETYFRRYDIDIACAKENAKRIASAKENAKRIALIALPFVGMYRPIAPILSLGMGACRIVSHADRSLTLEREKNWKQCGIEVGKTSLAILSLASSHFSFSFGLLITTGVDVTQGVITTSNYIYKEEYDKAQEEALQALTSGFYLGFMTTGALEMMLLSTLCQIFTCLYQAQLEYADDHKLEAAAKIILAMVYTTQAKYYLHLIERRNLLFSMKKYEDLIERSLKGKAVRHLIEHPLNGLEEVIDKNQVTLSNQKQDYDFGSHFHGLGKGLIKGGNLAFKEVVINGKKMIEVEFKVNHAFREGLQKDFESFDKLSQKELKEILQLTGSHVETIYTEKPEQKNFWFDEFSAMEFNYTLKLEGLGNIKIGASKDMPNLYDRVVVQMDSQKTIYDLHELMAFTHLDTALCLSTQDDLNRLKMGHLFRTFFPREATPFEVSEDFFSLPTQELKEKMIEKEPEMQQIFDTYFDRMGEAEILPGRIRYRIRGLSEAVYELGGRALTTAITGAYTNQELYERVASMLSMGMISSELKDNYNLFGNSGLGDDYFTGGADSIYTQMITKKDIEENRKINSYYHSKVRFLISLDALETGTYQYYTDEFGNRLRDSNWWSWLEDYASRPGILEFTKNLQEHIDNPNDWFSESYSGHEIMIKERLPPSFFTGIIIDSEKTKIELLDYLRKQSLIQKNSSGKEIILNIEVDRFFRIGDAATEELIL
jgi:hypothetical protein